jgi:hypothetical protein
MVRWISGLAVVLVATAANAQPVDPYAPTPKAPAAKTPTPAPTPTPPVPVPVPVPVPGPALGAPEPAPPSAQDPMLAEQIATSLVSRAQELIEARIWVDAKQLAVEALVKSPNGPSAAHAKAIIKQANTALGISESAPPVDTVKITDDKLPEPGPAEPAPRVDTITHSSRAGFVHGALYGGILGAAIGSFIGQNEASGAVPLGLGLGALGALAGDYAARKTNADPAQIRTVGAGTVWGGVIGGMFAGTVQGANGGDVNGSGVLVGASIGATVGGLLSLGIAKDHKLTTGDVALVDTFGGMGTLGGLTIGMLMQPAQREAYSLNAALGATAGVIVGYIAAPQTNTTERRMVRVAGLTLAGGAVPFLLYAGIHDKHGTWDERLTGGLSSLGLISGAWLGFYLTRDLDEGLDVNEFAKHKDADDAPMAVISRHSSGRWALGGVGVTPLSPQLSQDHGLAMSLLGGAW